MSGKRYIEGNTSEHTDSWCNQRAADALTCHLGQGQEVQNRVDQQPSQCFDFLNPLPVKKDDPDTYPPIVTIDGRVDTDIDHLIDDIESEYNGPVEEIPSKFPKPHVFSVIEGSLDDDVDNYVNDDGTMEHTLVDAPKHFNPIELKDVASKESNNRKSLGQVKGGTSNLPLTNRSYNKTNTEHSENDVSNDNMDAELSITVASQESSHMDHDPEDIADPSNSNMLVISECSHKLVEVKRVESEEHIDAEEPQTKSVASVGKSNEIKDIDVVASTANQHCPEVGSQHGIENSNIDLSTPKSVKEVANVDIKESSVEKVYDETSSKADDKTSSKADDKTSSKADDKTSSKADDKTSSKADDKTRSKADDKTSSKADDKTSSKADKTSSKADDKTSSKADDKTSSKADDKTSSKADKTSSKADDKTRSKADDKTSSKADDKTSSKADKTSSKACDKRISEAMTGSKKEACEGLAISSAMGDSVPPVPEPSKVDTSGSEKNAVEVLNVQQVNSKCEVKQEPGLEVDDLSQYEDIDFSLNKSPELEACSYVKAVSNSVHNHIKESRTPSVRGRKDGSPQISDRIRSNRIEPAESPGHKVEGSKRQSQNNKDLSKVNACADDSSSISSCFMKDSRCFDDKKSPVTSRIAPSPLAKEREKSDKEVKAPVKHSQEEVNSKPQEQYGDDHDDSLEIDDDDESESMALIMQLEEIKTDKRKSKELLNQIKLFLMESNVKEKAPASKAGRDKQQRREPVPVKAVDDDETSAQEDPIKNSDKEDSVTQIERSQDRLSEFPQVITQDEYYRKLYEQKGEYNTRVESSHLRKDQQSRRKRAKEEEKQKTVENDVPRFSNVQTGRIVEEQEERHKGEMRSKRSRQQMHDMSMREDKDNTLRDARSYEDDIRNHDEESNRGGKKRRGQQEEENRRQERKMKEVVEQNVEKMEQVSSDRDATRKNAKKHEKAKEVEPDLKPKHVLKRENSTLRKLRELTEWYTSERVPVKYIEPKGGFSAVDDAVLQKGPKRIIRSANASELFAPYYFERERARKARTVAAIKQLVDVNGESSGDGEALARAFYKSPSPVHVKAHRAYESVSAVSLASSQRTSDDLRVSRKPILPYELEQLLSYAQRKKSKPSEEYERNYIDDLIDSLKIRKPYSKEAQRSVKKSLRTALKIAEESVSAAAKVAQALSCVMQAAKPREVTDSSSDEMITRTERKELSKKGSMTTYKRLRRSHSVSPLKRRAYSSEVPRKTARPSPKNDAIVAQMNSYEQEPIVHTRRIRALSMQPSAYKDTSPLAQQKPVSKGRSSPNAKVRSSPSSKERPSPTRERNYREKEKSTLNEVMKKPPSSQRLDIEFESKEVSTGPAPTPVPAPVPAPVPTASSKASQATLDNYQQCNIVASNSASRPKEQRYRGKSESHGRESQHKPRNRSVESYVGSQYISKHEKTSNPPCDQEHPQGRERENVAHAKDRECHTANQQNQHKSQTKHGEAAHFDGGQPKRNDATKGKTKNVDDSHQETGQRKQLDQMRAPQKVSEDNHPEVAQHKRSELAKSQTKFIDHAEGVQHKRHDHSKGKSEAVDDMRHEKAHQKRPEHDKECNKLVEGIHSDIDHLKRYMMIHNEIDHLKTPETPTKEQAPNEKLTKHEQKSAIKHHALPMAGPRNHPVEEPRRHLDPMPMKGKDETLMEGFPLESGDDTWSIPPKSYNANRKTESYFTQVILPKPVTDSKSSKLLLRRQMQGSRVDSFADDGSDTSLEYNSNFNRTLQQISTSGYKTHFMHDGSMLDCNQWQDSPVENLAESMEESQWHHTYYRDTSQAQVENERCYTLEDRRSRSKSSSRKSRSRPGSQMYEEPGQRRHHVTEDESRDFTQSTSYRTHGEPVHKQTHLQSYKRSSQGTQEELLGSPAKPSQHRNTSSSHRASQPVIDSPESPAPKLAVLKQNILKCQVPFPDRKKDNIHRLLKEGSKPMFSPIFEEASDRKYNSASETDDLQSVEDEMWDNCGQENFNNGNIYGRSPSHDDLEDDSVDGSQFGHPSALRVEGGAGEAEEEYTLNDSASGDELVKDMEENSGRRDEDAEQGDPTDFSKDEGEESRSEREEESNIKDAGEEDGQSSEELENQEGGKSQDLTSSTFLSEQETRGSQEQTDEPAKDEDRKEVGGDWETGDTPPPHSPSSQVEVKHSLSRPSSGQPTPGRDQSPPVGEAKPLERGLSPKTKPVPLGEQTGVLRQASMDKYLSKIKQETKPVHTNWRPRTSDEKLCSRLAEISRGPSRLDNWLRKSQSASVANQALNRVIGQEAILRENLLIVKRLINQETLYSRDMQLKDYEQKLPLLRSFSRFPEEIDKRYGTHTQMEHQLSAKADFLAQEQVQAIDEYFSRGRRQLKRSLSLPPIRKRSSSSPLRRIESSYSRDKMEKDFQEHYKKMLTGSRFAADWSQWMPVKLKINLSTKQNEIDRKVKLATQRIDEMIRNKQPPYAPKQRSRT